MDLKPENIVRRFMDNGSRYHFDSLLLPNGYLQVDTSQDASYYGNWVNLDTRHYVGYAEGDVTEIQFESDEQMAVYLRGVFQLLHIDAGLSTRDKAMARAAEIGITDIMA